MTLQNNVLPETELRCGLMNLGVVLLKKNCDVIHHFDM